MELPDAPGNQPVSNLRARARGWGPVRKTVSAASLVAAIGGLATAMGDINVTKSVVSWVSHNAEIAIGVTAAAFLIDDLRQRASRHGSSTQDRRHRVVEEQRVKYLAFISASSGEETFYSLIFNHLVQCARALSDAGMRLILIPWFPKQSFDIGKELRDDVRALRSVNNFQFSGLFIIPDDPDVDSDDLRLLREVSDNIVFLDVNFDPNNPPADWSPCFVGGDEVRGGKLASAIAVEYLKAAVPSESPRVLVIRGRSTQWESQRYLSFREALVEAIPSADVVFSEIEAMYSRTKARDYVYRRLKTETGRRRLPHVIFGCNDDMAIGTHDAIRRLIREGALDESSAPRIVGYDGVREMVDLIDSNDGLILGTVDVSIQQLANHAMENMKRMIEGSATVHRKPDMRSISATTSLRPTRRPPQ